MMEFLIAFIATKGNHLMLPLSKNCVASWESKRVECLHIIHKATAWSASTRPSLILWVHYSQLSMLSRVFEAISCHSSIVIGTCVKNNRLCKQFIICLISYHHVEKNEYNGKELSDDQLSLSETQEHDTSKSHDVVTEHSGN